MYDYWFDADGNPHEISKMDSEYISNCLNQLNKMLNAWHGIIPEQLTREEIKQKDTVGMKAWFVFHGNEYIGKLSEELKRRDELEI